MTHRERVQKTLKFENIDRIPRHLWNLPGISMFRNDELNEVLEKYPNDIDSNFFKYGQGKKSNGTPFRVGEYTDVWGCLWHVGEDGVIGEIKEYIFSDWSALNSYEPPWELLNQIDVYQINNICKKSDKFMLVGTETRPFERLQFLRGTENVMMDLIMDEENIIKLMNKLHAFFKIEIEKWANTDVDGIAFLDDWGSQNSLLISPALWRKHFKPMYKDYCDIIHKNGKFAFMHSDGNIEAIYPDLIEIGVDALNSQLFCMNIETLGNLYSGKIVFWGEIDRQFILPFGTTADVKNAVKKVSDAFLSEKKTGVIAQCEWGIKDPKENIISVFEEWDTV